MEDCYIVEVNDGEFGGVGVVFYVLDEDVVEWFWLYIEDILEE